MEPDMQFEWVESLDNRMLSAWNELFAHFGKAHPEQHPFIQDLSPGGRFRFLLGPAACAVVREFIYPFKVRRWTISRGPVCRVEDLAQVLEEIIRCAHLEGISSIRLSPYFLGTKALASEMILKERGFRLCGVQGGHSHSVVVDLNPEENEILKSFNENTRRQLKKSGDVVITSCSPSDVGAFHTLHDKMNSSRGLPVMPPGHFEEFAHFIEKHPESGLFLVSKWQGRIVGGITVLRNPWRAWYLQGASDNSIRDLPLTFLCHWNAMKILKNAGVKAYDFGGLGDEISNPEIAGINRFKRGFSSREVNATREFEKVLAPLKHFFYTQGKRLEGLL